MKKSYLYLLLVCLMAVITYLDRVCISVAGPRMQDALQISPSLWGWVGTAFLLGYAIFEIPGGHWGDRIGPRRVLTRIVIWWSACTALTGLVVGYPALLLVRFLFGAGEAGAFPVGSVAISQWLPPSIRGRALGLLMMSGQIGGALSPLLVVPLQEKWGWRASFYVFSMLGLVWAAVWFVTFRDRPSASAGEVQHAPQSWKPILQSRDLWAIMGVTFAYFYTAAFFQTWLHTYLIKGRNFSESSLRLSSLPYFAAAGTNLLGGLTCDFLVNRVGLKWSRRFVGIAGLSLATLAIGLAIPATTPLSVILWLSLGYSAITFQQPMVFVACLDLGGSRGGAVTGFMNSAAMIGGACSSALFGYLVKSTGSYNTPLLPMAVLLAVGAALWMKVDITRQIKFT